MKEFLKYAKQKLNVDKQLVAIYCIVYFLWGTGMDLFGAQVEIAKFTYWWQVITCYILYMVPISLLLRGLPFHAQYAYGLVAMGVLEFGGYALQTSYAYPDNILDQFFNIRNFSLGMALFFALYFPLGNWGVGKIYSMLFKKSDKNKITFSTSDKYWQNRYKNKGNSGAGSYNNLATFKAEIINNFVKDNNIEKVIEFGSGDGNQLRYFDFKQYVGYDVSEDAVAMCREMYKNEKTKEFYKLPQDKLEKGELVMSLDVLYHLVEDDIFHGYMQNLFANSTEYVIIYSSNTKKFKSNDPHVRHREFTQWVSTHVKDFKLIKHVPNAYPYNKKKPRKTSFADFYIYQRISS